MKTKRAVSPILSAIILIAITIAGGLMVYSVFFSSAAVSSTNTQVAISEASAVEGNLCQSCTPFMVLSFQVQNTGSVPLNVCSMSTLLNGASLSTPNSAISPTPNCPTATAINPGGAIVVSATKTYTSPTNAPSPGDTLSLAITIGSMDGRSQATTQISVVSSV